MTSVPLTALQSREADSDPGSGFRLARLELYNWGTFDQRVWSFEPGGHDCLLTGDAGSGKSTIVDAITTLLLPAHRITYNKAAGAEARERSLRSYVLGYYKGERSDTTGASRPVPLRNETAFSVILGVFTNAGYKSAITLAQVFWLKDGHQGQPERFFVIAERDLSVAADFSDFGTEIAPLKKRLRAAGARVHDSFPEYGRDFRRRLGVESEQALELFHQAVSMKSVGNLTGFVREHMLEPFDAAAWTAKIMAHFEDLTNAHEAVRRAQAQILALGPLLADCDAHDTITADIEAATAQRSASRFFFAEAKVGLLEGHIHRPRYRTGWAACHPQPVRRPADRAAGQGNQPQPAASRARREPDRRARAHDHRDRGCLGAAAGECRAFRQAAGPGQVWIPCTPPSISPCASGRSLKRVLACSRLRSMSRTA